LLSRPLASRQWPRNGGRGVVMDVKSAHAAAAVELWRV